MVLPVSWEVNVNSLFPSSISLTVTYTYSPIDDAKTSPPNFSTKGDNSEPPPANEIRSGARDRTVFEITV